MKKRDINSLFIILVFSLFMSFIDVFATSEIDIERKGSLKLQYTINDENCTDLKSYIYKVGDVDRTGIFTLTDAFKNYNVEINDIEEQSVWDSLAKTLSGYVLIDNISEDKTMISNHNGMVHFNDLETGLYLVMTDSNSNDNGIITFSPFLISIPNLDTLTYHVFSKPKGSFYIPVTYLDFSIAKHWKNDYNGGSVRPQSVSLKILKGNQIYKSIDLSDKNNWSYKFRVEDDGSQWNVVEDGVDKNYKTLTERIGNDFIITNSFQGDFKDIDNPKTGDGILLYIFLLIIGVIGIFITLYFILKKDKKDEED